MAFNEEWQLKEVFAEKDGRKGSSVQVIGSKEAQIGISELRGGRKLHKFTEVSRCTQLGFESDGFGQAYWLGAELSTYVLYVDAAWLIGSKQILL